MKDNLGSRMKNNFEDRTRYYLPRRTYTILRIDGKGFHNFTKQFQRPHDINFSIMMDMAAKKCLEDIQGSKFAYVQSDEVSILLTDFNDIKTEAWFNGNIQKIASVSSSLFSKYFNQMYLKYKMETSPTNNGYIHPSYISNIEFASFDSRVFTIPDPVEVENYFIWRQQDAIRNSIQMLARSLYSHKECDKKNTSELQEMCFLKGKNWAKENAGFKNGRVITKTSIESTLVFTQERQHLKDLIYGK